MVSDEIATAASDSPRGSLTRRACGVCGRREQLSKVAKCLELEGIAARVAEEHGRLLSHLALEPRAGLDDELNPEVSEPVGERRPLRRPQHDAAMWHRHAVAVHQVEVTGERALRAERRIQVTDKLMAEQIEIHPRDIAAA